MPKKRRSCFSPLILPIVSLTILIVILLIVVIFTPQKVENIFGPPGIHLNGIHRYTYSFVLLWYAKDLTNPTDPGGVMQSFNIQPGESATVITDKLRKKGLISNADAFLTYLSYAGLDVSIQAGEYDLSPAMSPMQIAQVLQDATPNHVTFVIIPGWRIEEIARALPTSGLEITPEDFLAASKIHPPGYSFTSELPVKSSLEGFLFPDRYVLPRKISVDDFYLTILDKFEEQVNPEIRQGFKRHKLTLLETIIMASMVQREAILEEEMPMIASVFYNRLASNMKLDSDPTVQYALGYNSKKKTWWTNPLSLEDLQINSPYNTYLYKGLPPGPIANPGISAIRAVAFPAESSYYYFRAACDGSGSHLFAKTFEEHLNNACQ